MEKLKQDRLTSCPGSKRQWRRIIFLAVILPALCGQVTAQVNADRVADLINQLKSSDPTDREEAADALVRIGPKAKAAVPALIEALKDNDEDVRYSAADALEKIAPEAAKEHL